MSDLKNPIPAVDQLRGVRGDQPPVARNPSKSVGAFQRASRRRKGAWSKLASASKSEAVFAQASVASPIWGWAEEGVRGEHSASKGVYTEERQGEEEAEGKGVRLLVALQSSSHHTVGADFLVCAKMLVHYTFLINLVKLVLSKQPCGGGPTYELVMYYGVTLYVQNSGRICKEILQVVLQQCAIGRAVLPSVFHLPSSCAHQIHSSHDFAAYYFILTT